MTRNMASKEADSIWNSAVEMSEADSHAVVQVEPGYKTISGQNRYGESLFNQTENSTARFMSKREAQPKPNTAQTYNASRSRPRVSGAGYRFALMMSSEVRKTIDQQKNAWASFEPSLPSPTLGTAKGISNSTTSRYDSTSAA
jgi:hypothetical protein